MCAEVRWTGREKSQYSFLFLSFSDSAISFSLRASGSWFC